MKKWEKDLVALVADKNMQFCLQGLLSRPEALAIRAIRFDPLYVHPERDPGCLRRAHDFLRPMARTHQHALVMFDRVGCGSSNTRDELEEMVTRRLRENGWGDRAETIVLDPELEVWVWADSPEVARCLGWRHRAPDLRKWLQEQDLWASEARKPADPKQAAESVLRYVRRPRSSALYKDLASNVSLRKCSDPAFLKLRGILTRWFGMDT